MAGRLPHHHFRGLLGIHSLYGLSTRRTAERYMCLEGSDGFVTSTAAPIASGWSDRVSRAGLAPAGMTLPCHGTQHIYLYSIDQFLPLLSPSCPSCPHCEKSPLSPSASPREPGSCHAGGVQIS